MLKALEQSQIQEKTLMFPAGFEPATLCV
jgi:hypothetical protein